jgi:hypothetical protein
MNRISEARVCHPISCAHDFIMLASIRRITSHNSAVMLDRTEHTNALARISELWWNLLPTLDLLLMHVEFIWHRRLRVTNTAMWLHLCRCGLQPVALAAFLCGPPHCWGISQCNNVKKSRAAEENLNTHARPRALSERKLSHKVFNETDNIN